MSTRLYTVMFLCEICNSHISADEDSEFSEKILSLVGLYWHLKWDCCIHLQEVFWGCWTCKLEAALFFETSVTIYQSIRREIVENLNTDLWYLFIFCEISPYDILKFRDFTRSACAKVAYKFVIIKWPSNMEFYILLWGPRVCTARYLFSEWIRFQRNSIIFPQKLIWPYRI